MLYRCFCGDCCRDWVKLEEFGYFNAVRVCGQCKVEIGFRKNRDDDE